MSNIISEIYILMTVNNDDYEICYDEENNAVMNNSQFEIEQYKIEAEKNNYYDYPLVIVREIQEVIY